MPQGVFGVELQDTLVMIFEVTYAFDRVWRKLWDWKITLFLSDLFEAIYTFDRPKTKGID